MKTRSVTQHLSQRLCRQQGARSAGQFTLLPEVNRRETRETQWRQKEAPQVPGPPQKASLRKLVFPIGLVAKHLEEVTRELNQSCDATVKMGKIIS